MGHVAEAPMPPVPEELSDVIGSVTYVPWAGTVRAFLEADESLFTELTDEEAREWDRAAYARRAWVRRARRARLCRR